MELLDAYKRMFLLRAAEEGLVKHYIDKKVFSMVHFYVGQEAVAAGVCAMLGPDDLAMGTHRSHGYYLAKGGSVKKMAAELFGKASGVAHGKGGSMHMVDLSVGFAGTTPLLGSGVPIATGLAFAKKFKKEKGIVVVFYGDGASEEGVVYETYNLAALYNVPVLFVLENNGFSINSKIATRRSSGYDSEKIVTGLGVRYMRADGNDYGDVSKKAEELIQHIRTNGGPALLECMVYRHMAHSTPLMEERYRSTDTLEERLSKDCIANMRSTLLAQGVNEESIAKEETAIRAQVESDIVWADAQPEPKPEDLYTDVYA